MSTALICGAAVPPIRSTSRASRRRCTGIANFNVLGGPNHDIVNLGSTTNRLAGIDAVNVNGQGGADALNIFDQGTTAPRTYTLGFVLGNSYPYFTSDDSSLLYSNLATSICTAAAAATTSRFPAPTRAPQPRSIPAVPMPS